jgi:ribonuclease G
MTRKRIRKPLTRQLCEPCFYCEGEGYLLSGQSICYNIHREVLRQAADMEGLGFTLKVSPHIADLLLGEENNLITSLEHRLGKQITIYTDRRFHLEEFELLETMHPE